MPQPSAVVRTLWRPREERGARYTDSLGEVGQCRRPLVQQAGHKADDDENKTHHNTGHELFKIDHEDCFNVRMKAGGVNRNPWRVWILLPGRTLAILEYMPEREFPSVPLVGVGGVVVHENRVLLVQRGTEPLKGQWSIPGGLIDVGETLREAVIREVQEETGPGRGTD